MAFSGAFVKPFRPAFDAGLAAAAGNGLLNSLIAYWPLNEAAGANDALDLHTNGLTLTQQSSPGADAGKVYGTARTFGTGFSSYFTRASEALLQTGDVDFTLALWFYSEKTSGYEELVGRYTTAREFLVEHNITDSATYFYVSNSGGALTSVNAGNSSANVWHSLIVWHDSVANQIGAQLDGSAAVTQAFAGTIAAGAAPLEMGRITGLAGLYGRLGPVAFWKSAAGGGGVLDATKRAVLYNAGAGLAYSAFTT